jgi:dipeptidyl aminopeptidase/acylaminoacyl peptidase
MLKSILGWLAPALAMFAGPAMAQNADAIRFGTREAVEQISLSPDGTRVVYVTPGAGHDTTAFVATIGGTAAPFRLFTTDGEPERLLGCHWASNTRILCRIGALMAENLSFVRYSRWLAIDADGTKAQVLSAPTTTRSLGVAQGGGALIDWRSDKEGSVLMTRAFVPEETIGTRLASNLEGYGVERVDTTTLKRSIVEQPKTSAMDYISDGNGVVRVMGSAEATAQPYDRGVYRYFYRKPDSRDWLPLSTYNVADRSGFLPLAVDSTLNVVYGFERKDGRIVLYRISLDGAMTRELVFERPDVDVDDLIRVGRQQRVVGVSYVTDKRYTMFFDPVLAKLAASLSRALPGMQVTFMDASEDGTKLLLWAGSDIDPGRYYVFDRTAKQLNEIMLTRPPLEGATLAPVKSVTFTAADGTQIPAYLTLPPGSDGKNLPAIVMPHGGPEARDEWGFDWMVQYFVARGFAVLQPNFRGSAGYGQAWFVENGFKSWKTAIGDVNDGGRWLIAQGIADPGKLAIVGWSYGGYAALQSGVLDPDLFKAVIAIAPVTDLGKTKEESRYFSNYGIVSDFIGSGPHIDEGSPARNAGRIKAPVLMFHGEMDANVGIAQSRLMETRLREAGRPVELVTFPKLDHGLLDSRVRIGMLDRSDIFLRTSLGLGPKP